MSSEWKVFIEKFCYPLAIAAIIGLSAWSFSLASDVKILKKEMSRQAILIDKVQQLQVSVAKINVHIEQQIEATRKVETSIVGQNALLQTLTFALRNATK